MDETLKARLIGATVLVAVAVLLIPELLSGRRAETPDGAATAGPHGTRTFTIELGGGPATPAAAPSRNTAPALPPVLPATSAAPRSDASTAGPGSQAAANPTSTAATGHEGTSGPGNQPSPAAKVASAAPKPVQSASPAAPTRQAAASIPARGGWAVQVGAFGTVEAADKLVKELQAAGYKAYVSPVSRAGKPLHRVRVGPETDKARADGLATSLKGRGLPATVVAND